MAQIISMPLPIAATSPAPRYWRASKPTWRLHDQGPELPLLRSAVTGRSQGLTDRAATGASNAVNGDTSAGVFGRTNAIPAGTQVVAFDTGGDNDLLHGVAGETEANRAKIISAIRAHGAMPISVPYHALIGPQRSGGAGYQADGIHLTAQSHRKVAAYLVPLILAAAKQSR